MIKVKVQNEDFTLEKEKTELTGSKRDIGAIVSFIGTVRGSKISSLSLEHYPGMTEKSLEKIAKTAAAKWQLNGVSLIHRVGTLKPGDNIVLVITASKHRKDAFAGCEYIMDFLKTEAPFWKKEKTANGEHWVEARESDFTKRNEW